MREERERERERGRKKKKKKKERKKNSLPERVRGPFPVPVHPLLEVSLQELEDEVEHGLGVLLDVLDAEQPKKGRKRFFVRVFRGFSGFLSLSDEGGTSMVGALILQKKKKKKTNLLSLYVSSLDDVVGLGEHLEQGDLAQGSRGDALFLHLFFFVFDFFFERVVSRSRSRRLRREEKRPPPRVAAARLLSFLSLSFRLFPVSSACLSLSFSNRGARQCDLSRARHRERKELTPPLNRERGGSKCFRRRDRCGRRRRRASRGGSRTEGAVDALRSK